MSAHPVELELAEQIAQFYYDPLGFVNFAYPWRKAGTTLEHYDGPDTWQSEFLTDLGKAVEERGFDGFNAVMPVRMGASSGHGIGKSVLVAWIVDWLMSTRPHCQGTVTANTITQLATKTWPQIQRWTKMCATSHWFTINSERIYHTEFKESWFCSAQSSKAENSEAFAGQHAATSSSFYIMDEASAVPDIIYEVAEGGMTDGEPMIFAFGNPTRNTGKFYRAAFGSEMGRWNMVRVDSRTSAFSNKELINEWIDDYGVDSDFVRVRVLGLPPTANELSYIGEDLIKGAQQRHVEALWDEPLVAGFDVSGGGSAWNVIRFRRGADAASIPPIRLTGQQGRDRSVLIGAAAEVMRETGPRRVTAMFVDSAFGSPIVERLHTLGYMNVHEVSFGGSSPDPHQANMRAYMWYRTKEWMKSGSIPSSDENLSGQLGVPGYHINKQNQLVLESKENITKRGEASPDDADALALTFARPVQVQKAAVKRTAPRGGSVWS